MLHVGGTGTSKFVIVVALLGFVSGTAAAQERYLVKPGDTLTISVWKEPDLQGQVLVTPDGAFSFPLVGEVDARGKGVAELQNTIAQRLSKFVTDPVVTVSVLDIKGNKVYVIGQVMKAGEFVVNRPVDVIQALSMAGGATPFAKLDEIIVLRRTGNQQQAIRFQYSDVAKGTKLDQNIQLQAGDVVLVP